MSFLQTIFGSNSHENGHIKVLETDAFRKAISNKKTLLIDLRTPKEFSGGHLTNAINVDFFDKKEFKNAFEKMDRNKPVYLYCRSGNRSRNASRKLDQMGFKAVYDLKGGLLAWK